MLWRNLTLDGLSTGVLAKRKGWPLETFEEDILYPSRGITTVLCAVVDAFVPSSLYYLLLPETPRYRVLYMAALTGSLLIGTGRHRQGHCKGSL